MYTTYILQCNDGRFYIGSTGDIHKRLERHSRGECRFTKPRRPVQLVYCEHYPDRSQAMQREKQLKSWKNPRALTELINNSTKTSSSGPIV